MHLLPMWKTVQSFKENAWKLTDSYFDDDIVEAHCYIVITSESILMSKYVAESIN